MVDEIDSRAANVHAAELASIQLGLITNAQARALGMGKAAVQRRVQAGRWQRLRRGVYAFAGSTRTRQRDILEACLAAGPRAVVSAFTAAEVWKLPDIWRRDGISLAVPRSARRTSERAAVESTAHVEHPEDVDSHDGTPVMSVARTYVAIATELPEHVLARSIVQAIQRGLLDPRQLAAAVKRGGSAVAVQRLESILAARPWKHFFRSKDEQRAVQILEDAGMDGIETNVPLEYGGEYVGEIDLLHAKYRLAIEIDGPLDHSTEEARNADKVKALGYRATGLRVVRFPSERLRSGDAFIAAVARELQKPAPAPVAEEEFSALWESWIEKYGDPHPKAQGRVADARAKWESGIREPLPWLRAPARQAQGPSAR